MSNLNRRSKFSLLAVLAFTGCTTHLKLIAATVEHSGGADIVNVTLRAADAKLIKDREFYFSIVVFDCKNPDHGLPIEPYVSGQLATRFKFPIEGEFVTVRGSIPSDMHLDFKPACVFLEGGGYLFGKLKSDVIPIS
jgi:hypothetical protein